MDKIDELLTRGVSEVIIRDSLKKELKTKTKMRIKYGIDPTGPKIHIGRAIPIWALRKFQEFGHQVVLIIGDFTAQIGDASDKTAERQILTPEEIKNNMKTYIEQLGLILDMKKVEIHYNSEWLDAMSAGDLIRAAMNFTVNQMIKRDNFFQRFEADKPIGLHEIMYPLLQGYDSVAIKASIEIGGNDQLFNLLAGRTLQKKYGQKEQNVMTFDLLMGTDGRKMSTSYGNCIYIQDEPNEMFGKIMSIRDDLIIQYMTLVTDMKTSEIEKIEKELLGGMNPRDAKIILGKALVSRYYDDKKADDAAENFANVFKNNEMPEEIREFEVLDKEWRIVDLMHFIGLVPSKTEARRMIDQGGVRIDGAVIGDREAQIRPTDKMIIQIGKRKFVRIKLDK